MATQTAIATTPRFRFDPDAQEYVADDGRRTRDDDLKRLLFLLLLGVMDEMLELAAQVGDGRIPISMWQDRMADKLLPLHVAAAAAGVGGFARMTPEYYGRVSAALRVQYSYLDRFARQVEAGHRSANSPVDLARRTKLYARAVNRTFEQARQASHSDAGYTLERNALGASEHCAQCLAETAKGWVEIGTLSLPGTRLCQAQCRCRLQFSRAAAPPAAGTAP